jgi:hypothetical protein
LFKRPVFLGLALSAALSLQVLASYWSVKSFFEGDILFGIFFFLFVPLLGLALGAYILWFRKNRTDPGKEGSGEEKG